MKQLLMKQSVLHDCKVYKFANKNPPYKDKKYFISIALQSQGWTDTVRSGSSTDNFLIVLSKKTIYRLTWLDSFVYLSHILSLRERGSVCVCVCVCVCVRERERENKIMSILCFDCISAFLNLRPSVGE